MPPTYRNADDIRVIVIDNRTVITTTPIHNPDINGATAYFDTAIAASRTIRPDAPLDYDLARNFASPNFTRLTRAVATAAERRRFR